MLFQKPKILLSVLISIVISIIGFWQTSRAKRQDRQRQLFVDAFRSIMEYREFAYKVQHHTSGTDLSTIINALSKVQAQLDLHIANLNIEAPQIAPYYQELVSETKRVVDSQIVAGWDYQSSKSDSRIHISDVDFSELASVDTAFIQAVQKHLGFRWCKSKSTRQLIRTTESHEGDVTQQPLNSSRAETIGSHETANSVKSIQQEETDFLIHPIDDAGTEEAKNIQTKRVQHRKRVKTLVATFIYFLLATFSLSLTIVSGKYVIENLDKYIMTIDFLYKILPVITFYYLLFRIGKWILKAIKSSVEYLSEHLDNFVERFLNHNEGGLYGKVPKPEDLGVFDTSGGSVLHERSGEVFRGRVLDAGDRDRFF